MDLSNIKYGELKTMAKQLGVYPPDVIAAINAEIARRESEMQANAASQPSPVPVPDNPNIGVMNVDVQPPAGYYERQELETKNVGTNQPVQSPAYLQDVPQNESLGNQKIEAGNIVARDNIPVSPDINYPGGVRLFDDWVQTVPPEQLAKYTGAVPTPGEVPAKEPVNNRVFTVSAQKPAGMPSRVWEQMNPSSSTETTVTTIPTASQQNPYLGPTVQDPSSYSLENMDKLKPSESANNPYLGPTVQDPKSYTLDNMDKLKTPEQLAKEEKKAKKIDKSEELSGKIKDKVNELSESNDIGETGEQIASTASAMLADTANVGGSVDPSGTSATLRAQADTAAKQAALMDARRQAADRIWNRDLKAEADKKAAAGAAAENAQRIASTAAGESTIGQRSVKAADYNYEENRADTARREGTELSKDANQYQNAAYQRTMDAQKADYDYNENRRINNRIYALTGGIGVKKDDGSYQVVGGNRDKDNNPVTPEQQPTNKDNGNKNTQSADNGNNNTTTDNGGNNNAAPAPVPAPVPSTATSTPGSNLANIQDKKQERLDKRDTATSTPQPTTQSTDTASKQAAGVAPQSTEVPAYVSCLQRWYNFVTSNTNGRGTSDIGKLPMKSQADLQTVISYCDMNRKPGDPQFNLNDLSRDNLLKVYNYVEPYVYKKGGK